MNPKGIKTVANGLLIVALVITVISLYAKSKTHANYYATQLEKLQGDLLQRDSVIEIADGVYKASVQDNFTLKDLNNKLKVENHTLYTQTKELKAKITFYQQISIQPKKKVDTVKIDTIDCRFIESFYPEEKNYFVRFNREYFKDYYTDKWDFNPLSIDVVIQQEISGKYSAILKGAEWLQVSGVAVYSLPIPPPKKDNFDFYTAGGLMYNYNTKKPDFGLDFGFRIKKSIYSVGADTKNNVWIKYGILW